MAAHLSCPSPLPGVCSPCACLAASVPAPSPSPARSGPGCSSVGTAFLGEHGPYFMSPGSTRRLIRNRWSWHTLPASVIYLDAPAFVGFSYSNSSSEKPTERAVQG